MLNVSADVYRDQRTPDGMGGYTRAWVDHGPVRCRFSQPTAVERTIGAQHGDSLTHVVYLLPNADVQRGDELRRGSDVFLVLATYQPSVAGTYLRADTLHRQAGT
ncbi:head-tail adaptor protein [Streptomyces sp. NPDC014864]|uniref:phage head completion protein n=1 Tax=Streptomyces sp. NPDC014864 TaxID=3364924 RepID=UPI0036FC477A